MKNSLAAVAMLPIVVSLSACGTDTPPAEAIRPVRVAEVRYDAQSSTNRYAATVQSRYQVEQAFRVGGKVAQRKIEVGQFVRAGDVIAVLDDTDYRLAEDAAQQAWLAAVAQARQAASDQQRLSELKGDGSVSAAEDERARSAAAIAQASAEAEARKLELARNRLKYTALRASRSGVVTAVRFEVGQVVPEGQPVVTIADPSTPEIVVDVPENHLAAFKTARFKVSLTSAPGEAYDFALRELSPQAADQTRTYRARLSPLNVRSLPLGASATVLVQRSAQPGQVAALPASALTQNQGVSAVWVVRQAAANAPGTVQLMQVKVHGYRNDQVLVSGLPVGEQVVTAGVQKMAPGLKVAVPAPALAEAADERQAAR